MGKGYIHLYTGNGKGKTTASLGLALRAAGAGKKVLIAQFVKGMPYSEFKSLKYIPGITWRQYGRDCFIEKAPVKADMEAARRGLKEVAGFIAENSFDLVILDEICIAIHYHLFTVKKLLPILKSRPESMEIVLTGRYATQSLINAADLVTEMIEVKHYYHLGILAREGFEY
ncbi:MAG: cob(I)yrinic acid a,c-diamide adenosyltransferase [Bacteroidales bacterium]|jgi:cob(I)alamin adenosyltransferase|nr:cob(I)yrinic acid a,c-diamide adenosyltransferase [Bacteroidales bacterium]